MFQVAENAMVKRVKTTSKRTAKVDNQVVNRDLLYAAMDAADGDASRLEIVAIDNIIVWNSAEHKRRMR